MGAADSLARGSSSREGIGPQLFVAVVVVVLAQSTRVLFPIMYEIGEDWNFVLAGLVALGTFLAPVLVILVPRMPARAALIVGAVLMAGGLVSARLVDPIPAALGIAVVAASLAGVTLLIARSGVASRLSPSGLVASIVLGMAMDVSVRAAFGSWDLAWQSGVGSLVVVVAVVVVVVSQQHAPWSPASERSAIWLGPFVVPASPSSPSGQSASSQLPARVSAYSSSRQWS